MECVVVLVCFCSFSLSSSLAILGSDRHEIGITIFNYTFTAYVKVTREFVCTFSLLGICLILNISKAMIFGFISSRYLFIRSSFSTKVSLILFITSCESLWAKTFLAYNDFNCPSTNMNASYSITLLVD